MQPNDSDREMKEINDLILDTERESFQATEIQTPKNLNAFNLTLQNKKKFNSDLLKNIAQKTVFFIKKMNSCKSIS